MHHFDELKELISNDSKLTWIEKAELTCLIDMEQKEVPKMVSSKDAKEAVITNGWMNHEVKITGS